MQRLSIPPKARRLLAGGWLWRCGVCIGLVALFRYSGGVNAYVAATASSLQWPYVLLSFTCSMMMMAMRAWRWQLLVHAYGGAARHLQLLRIYWASFFLGAVTPGPISEMARIWHVRHTMPSIRMAVKSVVLDRILDILLTLAAGLLIGVPAILEYWMPPYLYLLSCACALLLAVAVCIKNPWQDAWSVLARKSAARFGIELHADGAGLDGMLKFRVAALSVASQLVWALQLDCLARAVGVDIGFWVLYGVCALATAIAALPSIAGTREAVIAMLLAMLGTKLPQTTSFSLFCLANFSGLVAVSAIAFVGQPVGVRDALRLVQDWSRGNLAKG